MNDEEIIGYDALFNSMMKCKRGVMWKASVASFVLNSAKQILKLHEELRDRTYKERKPKFFTVTNPKERKIMSISFRDRIYQRSLNDTAIYPQVVKHLIYDNGACQKGKGTKFTRNRMKCHLQKFFRKYGLDGYVLKMDIKKYYQNMRHDLVKDMFRKYLDVDTYQRAADIIDTFPGEVGFYPGSQIVQIAGIAFLDDVDHFIKEKLRVKHYVRYMDDMIIISHDKQELEEMCDVINNELYKIGLELHEKKTKITPLKSGFMFLGFQYLVSSTGKIIMLVDSKRVKAERRKLRRMAILVKKGIITKEKMDQCYLSWKSHVKQGNSYKLMRKMDKFYDNLWRR